MHKREQKVVTIPEEETRAPSFSFNITHRRVIPVSRVGFLKKKEKEKKHKVMRFLTVLTEDKSHE